MSGGLLVAYCGRWCFPKRGVSVQILKLLLNTSRRSFKLALDGLLTGLIGSTILVWNQNQSFLEPDRQCTMKAFHPSNGNDGRVVKIQ